MFSAVRPAAWKRTCTDDGLDSCEQRAVQATAKGLVILKGADCAEPEVSNAKSVPATLVELTVGNLTATARGTVATGVFEEELV